MSNGSARKSFFGTVFKLLKLTTQEWLNDKTPQLGAAQAYYSVFSLAPIIRPRTPWTARSELNTAKHKDSRRLWQAGDKDQPRIDLLRSRQDRIQSHHSTWQPITR
jgi:hypothetical protein